MIVKRRKRDGNKNQQRNTRIYRKYVFGLNLRQFLFSVLAVGVAVAIYFGLRNHLGTETVSWLCILGAAPFAALGFLKYNGMPAEKFVAAFIRSEFFMPRKLVFRSTNLYYELTKDAIREKEKEAMKEHA